MELPLGQIVGLAIAILLTCWTLVNGVVMMISPRTWLRMPLYLAFQGTLRSGIRAKSASTAEIRILGFMVTSLVLLCLASFFRRPNSPGGPVNWIGFKIQLMAGLAFCAIMAVCGLIMLLSPKWWFKLCFGATFHQFAAAPISKRAQGRADVDASLQQGQIDATALAVLKVLRMAGGGLFALGTFLFWNGLKQR